MLRAEPCLFGLSTVAVFWPAALPAHDCEPREPTCTGKPTPTRSDAITLLRRDLWRRWLFTTPDLKLVLHNSRPT